MDFPLSGMCTQIFCGFIVLGQNDCTATWVGPNGSWNHAALKGETLTYTHHEHGFTLPLNSTSKTLEKGPRKHPPMAD